MSDQQTPTTVRLRLREVLQELGMTQRQLAAATGLSEQAITNLMKGPIAVRLDTLALISQATGKPVSELIVQD